MTHGRLLILTAVAAGLLAAPMTADAATVTRAGSTITIAEDTTGNPATEANHIVVTAESGALGQAIIIEERGSGQLFPVGCQYNDGVPALEGKVVRCNAAGITDLVVDVAELSDVVSLNSATLNMTEVDRSTINGGAGLDTLSGLIGDAENNAGEDTINGQADDDTIFGYGGNDTLDGGAGGDDIRAGDGDDTLRGGQGRDEMQGGAGNDTVDYESQGNAAGAGVGVELSGRQASGTECYDPTDPDCEGDTVHTDVENAIGTAQRDILRGSDLANRLEGRGGNDDLHGNDERVYTQRIYTVNDGADTLLGEAGDDRLRGGRNNDTLTGGTGIDTVDYTDRVATPGDTNDNVTVDLSSATATNGGAPDGPQNSRDTVTTVENAETGAGDDTLIGDDLDGGNYLHGGAGDDTLRGKDGPDELHGGVGFKDTVSYVDDTDNTEGVNASIGDGDGNDGNSEDGDGDTIHEDVEHLTGGPDDDTLTGDADANRLDGASGNDTLKGLLGADVFIGGAGADWVTYDDRTVGVFASLDGQANDGAEGEGDNIESSVENLRGGDGDDVLVGNSPDLSPMPAYSGNNAFEGLGGNDVMRGGLGADSFAGWGGEDVVDYSSDGHVSGVIVTIGNETADDGSANEGDNVRGDVEAVIATTLVDILSGDFNNNKLLGLDGDDTLDGFGGNDIVDGGAGADNVSGGTGDDLMHGGSNSAGPDGADTIGGGAGNDTVSYSAVLTGDVYSLASKERAGTVNVSLDDVANDGAPGEADKLSLIENVIGGAGNDTLIGTSGLAGSEPNVLEGRGGNDTLNPGSEGDTPRSDTLIGGDGAMDIVDYSTRPASDDLVVTLDGEDNDGEVNAAKVGIENDDVRGDIEGVYTGAGDDDVTGNAETANIIKTNAGGDIVRTRDSTADNVDCGPGTDSAIADRRDILISCEAQDLPEQPQISVSDVTVPESAGNAVFTISIDDTIAQPVTVTYTTSDGTAVAGQDYESRSGQATIPAGQTSTTVSVPVTQDTLDEDAETFKLTLTAPTNAQIAEGGNEGIATITDDDNRPTVSVGSAEETEGTGGTKTMNVPITLSAASSKDVTVKYSTADGTAKAGEDYEPVTEGTVTIPAGETTANAPVQIIGDTLDEAQETFEVILSEEPTNATLGTATGTQKINDDDGEPTVTVADASVSEGTGGTTNLSFTVTLSQASSKTVSVNYATSDGTATAGQDYTASSGTVTFQPGETSKQVLVPVTTDAKPEQDETLTLTLSNPSNATLTGDTTATGTILDDDSATISVVDAPAVTEGNSGTTNATFTVTLDKASERTVTVKYTTASGSAKAGDDFTPASGTLTFTPNDTSETVTVPVKGDVLDEADETFTLELSQPTGGTLGRGTGTGTINDDDPLPSLSVADVAVAEGDSGNKQLTFTVTQSAVSGRDVTFKYITSNETAKAGEDYAGLPSSTGTIAAGQTSTEIKVTIVGDTVDEADETLRLTLSEPVSATITDGEATGTITDDDGAPSLSVSDATTAEGNAGATELTFPVTLSNASGSDVTVKFATSDGSAVAGTDYTATSGTLTIPAGQTTGEIKVPVTGDAADEADETFAVTLTDPAGATLDDGSATGTITDDDDAGVQPPAVPGISVGDVKVNEGDTGTTPAVFTVSLTVPTTTAVTVKYVTSDGTATSGSDYAVTAGTLTFAPGERSKTVTVPVMGDRRDESDEAFALVLVDPQNGTVADANGAGLIVDDESPRVAPKRVSATTTPARDRSLPYRFRTDGRITLPSGVRRSDACAGKVQVRFKAGSKTISTRRVNLRKDCTFTRRVSFGIRSRLKPGRLKVEVRFLGNAVLLPKSAPKRYVRVVK